MKRKIIFLKKKTVNIGQTKCPKIIINILREIKEDIKAMKQERSTTKKKKKGTLENKKELLEITSRITKN